MKCFYLNIDINIIVYVFVFLIFALPLWYGKNYGFGTQCHKAGFQNAEFENCVKRKVKGGNTYEEH